MFTLWHILARVSPTLVDALMVYFYIDTVSWMKQTLFQSHSAIAGWLVMVFFALLIIGVFLLRFLEKEEKTVPAIFGYPSLGFTLIILMIAIQALGVFDGQSAISDTQGGILTLVFVILAGLYVAAALGATPVETKNETSEYTANPAQAKDHTDELMPSKQIRMTTPRYFFVQLFSLVTIALAMIMAGAYWEFSFFELEPAAKKSLNDTILMMLWLYPTFLIFFASPRLLFLTKNFTWYGLLSALGSTGYYVWVSASHIAL